MVPRGSPKPATPSKLPAPQIAKPSSFLSGGRPRLLYLTFVLAFLPLVFQTLRDGNDVEERLEHTLSSHPEIAQKLDDLQSEEELFALLPDGRIEGAHLTRSSRTHWVYAAIATAAFFAVVWFLFESGPATIAQWLIVLLVTSTVGIVSLIAFQWIADATQGVWITGRSIIVLLFYIVKFIGFSYRAATDPSYGFWPSFFGFTFGVGLCEELTKALPVIVLLQNNSKLGWRAGCILGLASGVGFGVAEGIMYAGHYYNGVTPGDIYLTRFISCVALHATWTATVGVIAAQNLSGFETSDATEWCTHLLMLIAVPAVLHGLYDTLLKREMGGFALVIAVASFAWLAFMIERARGGDTEFTPSRIIRAAA